jgi:hypothetical protein
MEPTPENLEQKERPGYDLEVLCASWTPLATAIAEPVEACRELVVEPATANVDDFLASFYRSQQG